MLVLGRRCCISLAKGSEKLKNRLVWDSGVRYLLYNEGQVLIPE